MTTNTKFWTWEEIWSKMKSELDLEEEDFVDETEAREYANDAIDEAESLIHQLNADYFLTKYPADNGLEFVDGQDAYDMPNDIYAQKIRKVIVYQDTMVYECPRLPDMGKFAEYREARVYPSSNNYNLGYFVDNITPSNPRLKFSPVPVVGGRFEVWYYRNANRLEDLEDVCDIPEFVRFVFDYIRERVSFKEAAGSGKHQDSVNKLEETRRRMKNTLQDMAVDGEDYIEGDFSLYEEHE